MLNQTQQAQFCKMRRQVIARNYQNLNQQQRLGALTTEGPLLLLAGAGSGKTTVLIHRIANLHDAIGRGSDPSCMEVPDWATPEDVEFLEQLPGLSGDRTWLSRAERLCAVDPAAPWSIIAITFTNKAAGELKERLERHAGAGRASDVWALHLPLRLRAHPAAGHRPPGLLPTPSPSTIPTTPSGWSRRF